jgi:FkbM family methyltransferase
MIKKILKYILGKDNGAIDNFVTSLKPEIRNFKTVLDVGAYHGDFIAEILKCNATLSIHAFEPFKESFDFINERFAKNTRLKLNHVAISDIKGMAILNINAFKETNSLLESENVDKNINLLTKQQSTEKVEVITLDEYCNKNEIDYIDLIKIDTQGNSFNVLKGLDRMLTEKKINYLYVEAEFTEIYKNEKLFSEIELLMRSYNYSIVKIYNLNYINKKQLGWCDVLFSPKNM